MFLVQTIDGKYILESEGFKWIDVPEGITDVQLIHPILNLSVGLHGYEKYAFLSEGVYVMQGGFNVPRIAEILYGKLGGSYVSVRLFRTGGINTTISDKEPEIDSKVWRNKEAG